jgi:hypothetical protein
MSLKIKYVSLRPERHDLNSLRFFIAYLLKLAAEKATTIETRGKNCSTQSLEFLVKIIFNCNFKGHSQN